MQVPAVSVNISSLYKSATNNGRLEALAEATKIPDVIRLIRTDWSLKDNTKCYLIHFHI